MRSIGKIMSRSSKSTSPGFLLLVAGFLLQLAATLTSAIGVNYGRMGDNLPPPAEVANFLRSKTTIDAIKIFDTNPEVLNAFANTGISVTVNIANDDIPSLDEMSPAKDWVNTHIIPFYPKTKITRVLVGNEVMQSANRNWIYDLVPSMRCIHKALVEAGINDIQVSTANTLGFLGISEPPSAARFRIGYDREIIGPMLEFLRQSKSVFMINPYAYFDYTPAIEDYLLFRQNKGIYDNNTKITYYNMFDAQMDAVYSAMKAMGYTDVPIVIAETGWASAGDASQPHATVTNAAEYNSNVIKKVTSGQGTPLMPNRPFETYIFALFNENQKPGATSEKNFGLFRPDFTPVYDAGVMRQG